MRKDKRYLNNNKNSKNNKKNYNNNENMEKDAKLLKAKEENDFSKDENYIYGINPVRELLKEDKDINKIWVLKGNNNSKIKEIVDEARAKKLVVMFVDKPKIDKLAKNNQGIVASVNPYEYVYTEDILEKAKRNNEDPFIIILDKITDSNNLGAIIRTAEAAGAHGIIIPKRNSAQLTPATNKTSAGAVNHMMISRVPNITSEIEKLKENGLWIIGTDVEKCDSYYNTNLKGPIAIVIGSEENGISRIVKEKCDILVNIPMIGKVRSLNASASAAILIYDVVRQRNNL